MNGEAERGKTAVVLSGGGAKGAYEVGVLKALINGESPSTGFRPIEPEIYTGTSVGAYNATIMASQPGARAGETVDYLERLWLERIAQVPVVCGSGIFRLRGFEALNPFCLLNPVAYAAHLVGDTVYLSAQAVEHAARFVASDATAAGRFLESVDVSAFIDPEPLRQLVEETVDLDDLARAPQRLVVTASNWELGTPRVFDKREIVERVGGAAILASMAIPGIYPPVEIDNMDFVDGGVLMNTPLKPAIAKGADVLHVVFLDPLVQNSDLRLTTFDALARTYAIITANQVRNDLLKAALINRGIELLERLERGEAISDRPGNLAALGRAGSILRRRSSGERPRRKLVIHSYRPPRDLGGSTAVLDFHRQQLESMIRQGYEDAVSHRCSNETCVVVN